MPRRRPTTSLRRRARPRAGASLAALLGEDVALPALQLALLWVAALHLAPLAHAVQHGEGTRGHCHGAVCHDLDDGSPSAEVRDGSLPDFGGLDLAHGGFLALSAAPLGLVGVSLDRRPLEVPGPRPRCPAAAARSGPRARGPPCS
jgi:hypothetical protein